MTADLIITNARAYTVDPKQPWIEAVAVRNGRFHPAQHRGQICHAK